MNPDWTWLLIGIAVGFVVVPMATRALSKKA